MKGLSYLLVFIFIVLFFPSATIAEDGWYLQSHWGFSNSIHSSLAIKRNDKPGIVHTAKWKGKSFKDSWYYTVKVDHWKGDRSHGIEWIHHKAYLANPPEQIEHFSISDGYNLLMFNRGSRWSNGLINRIGAGLVFGHPDMKFRDEERFYMKGGIGGNYLAGVAAQYSIEKRLYEIKHFIFTLEGKVTASFARVPISEDNTEYAEVPLIAWHITFGLGSKPLKKGAKVRDWARYIGVPFFHHYSMYLID